MSCAWRIFLGTLTQASLTEGAKAWIWVRILVRKREERTMGVIDKSERDSHRLDAVEQGIDALKTEVENLTNELSETHSKIQEILDRLPK